jgi:hypothetical protein
VSFLGICDFELKNVLFGEGGRTFFKAENSFEVV